MGLRAGDEDARIDQAIAHTRAFFESLGVRTRLVDYGIGAEAVERIVAQLEAHRMVKLGEDRAVDLALSRRIVAACL